MRTVRRRAARVLLLDPADRLLLIHGFDPAEPSRSWWFTPGGGLEPGEDPAAAALREVAEETGIRQVALGPVVALRRTRFTFDGRRWVQDECYYLGRTAQTGLDDSGRTELERRSTDALRWWSAAELATTRETVYPARLAALFERLIGEGPPARPVRLGGVCWWSTMGARATAKGTWG